MDKKKVISEYMGSLGKIGGKSKSPAKLKAVKENMGKANRALQDYWVKVRSGEITHNFGKRK